MKSQTQKVHWPFVLGNRSTQAESKLGVSPMSLWHHQGFLLLWGGQSISQIGSQITLSALPLIAILFLKATPNQMGFLVAAESAPYLLIGLLAGVWVDRIQRRYLLIAADVGRALLLGSIPVAAWFGQLSIAQLYFVGFLTGTLAVIFDVAYQSFLPTLIAHNQLIEGNSKLETTAAFAGIIGPGLAGGLIQLVTGPFVILIDVFSFVLSFLSLMLIDVREPFSTVMKIRQHFNFKCEAVEGLQTVLGHPILRAIAGGSGIFNFFYSALFTVYALFLTREIGMAPVLVGVVFAIGGVGGLLGALLTKHITKIVGLKFALLSGVFLASIAEILIGLATGPLLVATLMVIAGEALAQAGAVLYRINSVSLRQNIVPDRLQGRVNATVRVISLGVGPLGAIMGGILGNICGLRLTVLITGSGTLLAFLWVLIPFVQQLDITSTKGKTQC
jgi:MFS family permease